MKWFSTDKEWFCPSGDTGQCLEFLVVTNRGVLVASSHTCQGTPLNIPQGTQHPLQQRITWFHVSVVLSSDLWRVYSPDRVAATALSTCYLKALRRLSFWCKWQLGNKLTSHKEGIAVVTQKRGLEADHGVFLSLIFFQRNPDDTSERWVLG